MWKGPAMSGWRRTFHAAAVAFIVAGTAVAQDADPARVVATVNGTKITLGQMIALRETLPEQYLQLPDDALFNGILEQLIQQVALAKRGEAEIGQRGELALENHRLSYLSAVVLDKAANAAVTDAALQALFAEKYADAAPEKEFSAAHILVATEDEAKAIVSQIEGGGDFAEIAKTASSDRGSAAAGGELGWFGLGMMVEPFEAAVIALEPGKVSAPVESQFGWHVIRLNETRMAEGPTLEEKRDELAAELQQAAVEATVKAETDAAEIIRSAEGIDPALLKQTELLGE